MGVCYSKRLCQVSSPPTASLSLQKAPKPCPAVSSRRPIVPTLGPVAANPMRIRRAKQMQATDQEPVGQSGDEDTVSPGLVNHTGGM